MNLKTEIAVFVGLWLCFFASQCFAFTQPDSGGLAYELYDIAVNKILKGPIGFIGGVGCIVTGGLLAMKNSWGGSIACILGGAAMIKADTIAISLGAIIK